MPGNSTLPHSGHPGPDYVEHARRLYAALGLAVQVEHTGSTSVPGLAAKPIIDILITVEDITAE